MERTSYELAFDLSLLIHDVSLVFFALIWSFTSTACPFTLAWSSLSCWWWLLLDGRLLGLLWIHLLLVILYWITAMSSSMFGHQLPALGLMKLFNLLLLCQCFTELVLCRRLATLSADNFVLTIYTADDSMELAKALISHASFSLLISCRLALTRYPCKPSLPTFSARSFMSELALWSALRCFFISTSPRSSRSAMSSCKCG